jgi:hypothetical protein
MRRSLTTPLFVCAPMVLMPPAARADGLDVIFDPIVNSIDHALTGVDASAAAISGSAEAAFYFIPTTELPLLDPLRSLGVPEPVLNIFQPALQVIVEAGYDRSIPFGDPTPAELIPTIDPATFTLEFVNALVQGANNAFGLVGAQLPGFDHIESAFAAAEAWSEQTIGAPYDQVVTELNNSFDPFIIYDQLEGPIGQNIENLLIDSGIQQNILDPVLSLVGPFCTLFTS